MMNQEAKKNTKQLKLDNKGNLHLLKIILKGNARSLSISRKTQYLTKANKMILVAQCDQRPKVLHCNSEELGGELIKEKEKKYHIAIKCRRDKVKKHQLKKFF